MKPLLSHKVAFGFAALVLSVGCNKDEEKGDSLGLPAVKPPVEAATPNGIKSGVALLLQGDSPLKTLASRIFSPGPTDVLDRLGKVDESLASMDSRAQESEKACISDTPVDWAAPSSLPTGTAFPLAFQCQESIEANGVAKIQMAFGIKDDYANLVQIQTRLTESASAPAVATLVKAKMDGSSTEAWITMQKFDLSPTASNDDYFWLAIKGDSNSKSFEMAVGGTGKGIGVDCGVQVKSDGSYVFAKGIFSSYGTIGGETCSGSVGESVELCVDASTLVEVDSAKCEALSTFSLPAITHLGMASTGKAASDAFIGATISGYTEFSEDK